MGLFTGLLGESFGMLIDELLCRLLGGLVGGLLGGQLCGQFLGYIIFQLNDGLQLFPHEGYRHLLRKGILIGLLVGGLVGPAITARLATG